MRILFSAVPAHGHLLPLAPLMEAAVAGGNTVGLLGGPGVRPLVAGELDPGVQLLGDGAGVSEFLAEAAARTGGDPTRPDPAMLGEIFGAARLSLDGGQALRHARDWAPDLVVAEAFDTVGPLVAAGLGIPWHQVGIGPGPAPAVAEVIERAVLPYYRLAGIEPRPASSYLDPCPPALQDPGWASPAPRLPVRARAHRRPGREPAALPGFRDPGRPTVLLTLGTVFTEEKTLAALGSAVADAEVNVLATLGLALAQPPETAGGGELQYVSFAPMDRLLDGVRLVVAAGGSGTVLGALSRGKPMVLWPQGADQPVNAALAAAAGVAIVVNSAAEVTDAVTRALHDDALHARAAEIAAEIARAPEPAEVMTALADHAQQSRRGEVAGPVVVR
ncbi:MAG TPA: nucleotide disphospho-sugar-binding domain-containing protein [Amycolatopsis sp.]